MGIHPKVVQRAVFLDRDGVINRVVMRGGKPYPPTSVAELELLPGVPRALEALKGSGYHLVVVTNQPDVARGTTSRGVVELMNSHLRATLPLDAVLACFHDDRDQCDCRKPRPGLIMEAARLFNIDRAASFMVGDRWRDMEAGRRAGCKTLFVDHHYDERRPESCDYRVDSLLEAAAVILQREIST